MYFTLNDLMQMSPSIRAEGPSHSVSLLDRVKICIITKFCIPLAQLKQNSMYTNIENVSVISYHIV